MVDNADVQAILDAAAGQAPPGYNRAAGHVNRDGSTGLLDALLIAHGGNPEKG